MSEYKNFTSDFPERCIDVLDMASVLKKFQDREVTLLLMTAASGFLVPFERLKPNSSHPSGDNKRFPDMTSRLGELIDKKFVGSELCPELNNSWRFAKNVASVEGAFDDWFPSVKLKPVSGEFVRSMLPLIRNALAHGNIYSKGNPIKELIFVQEQRKRKIYRFGEPIKYEVLNVNCKDFEAFIRAWIEFLSGIPSSGQD